MRRRLYPLFASLSLILAACSAGSALPTQATYGPNPQLGPVQKHLIPVLNIAPAQGWPGDTRPAAPPGFVVRPFGEGLNHPRWLYVLPNGDVLVAEANTEPKSQGERREAQRSGKAESQQMGESANRITLLRDTDGDGSPDVRELFLEGLNQPLGMLLLGDQFYVANTDGLWRYPYQAGRTSIQAPGQKLLELPAGGYNNHWTRNLLANADGSKIYVSVGSASNVAEHGIDEERRRANILEVNPDGSGERIYASGLRNPVGMGWAPGTSTLWTAVNERDYLGDELVPDVALGAHTASLGLAFYTGNAFPEKYRGGAFIGQHGSWNRSELSGYKVVFVPFQDGRPSGEPEDFLTGFIADLEKSEVHGRPVGIAVLPDGSLLVADDSSNTVWRVAARR
jgi:glucose/arabinose dehydrogenase